MNISAKSIIIKNLIKFDAFEYIHTLTGSYLFQKGRVFHRSFGFSIFKFIHKEQWSISELNNFKI
jgi:hypothetical protein